MSEKLDENDFIQNEQDNEKPLSSTNNDTSNIDFIFQDEKKIGIPLWFLKNYPNSMMSKTYESPENYLEDENAYYIDSPSLSIDKLVEVICNSASFDFFSLNELYDLYKNVQHFLRLDYVELKARIEAVFMESFKTFITKNGCELHTGFNTNEDENDEYKREYYEKYYPFSYKRYLYEHPDVVTNMLIGNEIYSYYPKNEQYIEAIKKEVQTVHFEIIDIDIDEEIRNEKEEEKPDLYIENLFDYSNECFNEKLMEKVKHFFSSYGYEEQIIYHFSYIDDNGNDSIEHLLQINIPPFLQLLKDSIYSSLELFDFYQFIDGYMYPEYIQLFKDIITTHVFPNVTTLKMDIRICLDFDKNYIKHILSLFTRDRFPKLHIYDFEYYKADDNTALTFIQMDILVPISLLNLMDTIKSTNDDSFVGMFLQNKNVLNNLLITKKQYNFNIIVDIWNYDYFQTWKQLYNNGLFAIENVYYSFYLMSFNDTDNLLTELSEYQFKSLTICTDTSSYEILHNMESDYKNMNFNECRKLMLLFNFYDCPNDGMFLDSNFFYSDQCMKLSLWSNVQSISINFNYQEVNSVLNNLINIIKTNQLTKLKSLKFCNLDIELSSLLKFIESFRPDSSISYPSLDEFIINNKTCINVFEYFPNCSFYWHKPINAIIMNDYFNCDDDTYYEYIYNQLQQDYCKNIISIKLNYYSYDYTKYSLLINYCINKNDHDFIIEFDNNFRTVFDVNEL
ncbi:hypothetical protein WA158_000735 [Blastocystis sp. Blastoise]